MSKISNSRNSTGKLRLDCNTQAWKVVPEEDIWWHGTAGVLKNTALPVTGFYAVWFSTMRTNLKLGRHTSRLQRCLFFFFMAGRTKNGLHFLLPVHLYFFKFPTTNIYWVWSQKQIMMYFAKGEDLGEGGNEAPGWAQSSGRRLSARFPRQDPPNTVTQEANEWSQLFFLFLL